MSYTADQQLIQIAEAQFTRRRFLQGTLVAGAGIAFVAAVGWDFATADGVAAAGPLDSDLETLNYALALEHLEAAAYRTILAANVLSGRALTYFRSFGEHEAAHVAALTATIRKLGGTPVGPASYNFGAVPKDAAGVIKFFQMVETIGASAYLGAGASIRDPAILEAALDIHAVEAEHAAALAILAAPGTDLFAPEAFATPRSPEEVLAIIAPFLGAAPSPLPPVTPPPVTPPPVVPPPPPAPPVPGMPNTGGGGQAGGRAGLRETIEALSLAGIASVAVGALARRRAVRPATHAEGDDRA
jgi:hypothetical protein